MTRNGSSLALAALLALAPAARAADAPAPAAPPAGAPWALNATVIEACSCPMFCQCYFNDRPAAHGASGHAGHGHEGHGGGGQHFCKFNNAFQVNRGAFGDVRLDGAKFWVAGDLGAGEFSKGQMDWAVVTFDRATTKAQRDAIAAILAHLYPVQWRSLTTAEADMTWKSDGTTAVALLDGGKTAEVRLKRFPGMTDAPVVIQNLKYWGAPRNDGFVLMPNEVEAYRAGAKAFEFKGTNGFLITVDIASTDVAAAPGSMH